MCYNGLSGSSPETSKSMKLSERGENLSVNSNTDSSDEKPTLSASQVDTWMLCQRKWAWSYIEKLKKSNLFATQGTEIHQVLADWLEKGKSIDTNSAIGKIVLPGLKYLPAPGTPGLEIEKGFSLETEVAKYRGFKDMQWFDNVLNVPIVGDHKSTTDFKWAKTEEDLRDNTQANLYAYDALCRYDAKEVELRWVYYRTRGAPGSQLVKLRVHAPEVLEQMEKIDEVGAEIATAYAQLTKATDAPANPRACEAFGGCVYLQECNLSSQERMRAFMTQESIKDRLRNRKTEHTGGAVAPAKPASPVAEVAPVAAAAPAKPVAPVTAVAPAVLLTIKDKLAARAAQGVNPPPVQVVSSASPPADETARTTDAPAAIAETGTDASAPKKRGRPSNAELQARAAAAAAASNVEISGEENQNATTSEGTTLMLDGVKTTERAAAKQADADSMGERLANLVNLAKDFKSRYGLSVEIKIV